MIRHVVVLAAALLAPAAYAIRDAVPPTKPVALLTPIGFSDHATSMEWIKSECELPKTVQADVAQVLRDTGVGGDLTDSLASGYVIKVVIERANAQKGGSLSGPKTLSLSVNLYGDGVLLRSTEVSGESRSINVFAGSCLSLQRASGKLAQHVSEWLRNVDYAKGDHLATRPALAASAP